VRIGAPSFLIKNTTNFAGFVLLALRLTVILETIIKEPQALPIRH